MPEYNQDECQLERCSICRQSFNIPKLLTCCSETICESCESSYFSLKSTPVKCPICDQHLLISKSLPVNKHLERYMSCKRRKTDPNIYLEKAQMLLKQNQDNLESLHQLIKHPENYINQYFGNLRNSIDLYTEELIEHIQEQRKNYLDELDKLEKKSESFIASNEPQTGMNFAKFKKIIEPFVKELNQDKQKLPSLSENLDFLKNDLDLLEIELEKLNSKIDHFKNLTEAEILMNKEVSFTFGNFKIYNFFLLNFKQKLSALEGENFKIFVETRFKDLNEKYIDSCINHDYFNLEKIISYWSENFDTNEISLNEIINYLDKLRVSDKSLKEMVSSYPILKNNSIEPIRTKVKNFLETKFREKDLLENLKLEFLFKNEFKSHTFHIINSDIREKFETHFKNDKLDFLKIECDLDHLSQMSNEFESLIKKPEVFVRNYFASQREINNIQVRTIVRDIEEEYSKVLEQIKHQEAKCLEFIENKSQKNELSFKDFKNVLIDFSRDLKETYSQIKSMQDYDNSKKQIKILYKKIVFYSEVAKNELIQNKSFSFLVKPNVECQHSFFKFSLKDNYAKIKYFDSINRITTPKSLFESGDYGIGYDWLEKVDYEDEDNENSVYNNETINSWLMLNYVKVLLRNSYLNETQMKKYFINELIEIFKGDNQKHTNKSIKAFLNQFDFFDFINVNDWEVANLKTNLNIKLRGMIFSYIDQELVSL